MSSQIEAEDHGNTKKKNKKRFSEEQIKSLESIFESETKLEPAKKLEIATKLGLQPRQIAIWFQNKRARWKSKQIEQDYSSLLANYQKLASSFDSLNNERQSLIVQLEKLNKELEESNTNSATCNNYGKVENDTNEAKLVVDIKGRDNKKLDSEYRDQEDGSLLVSNDESQLYNNINRLDSQSFDLTCTTSQWFNFWTT